MQKIRTKKISFALLICALLIGFSLALAYAEEEDNSSPKQSEPDYYIPASNLNLLFITSSINANDDSSLFKEKHYRTLKKYRESLVYENFRYHRFSSRLSCWAWWAEDPLRLLHFSAHNPNQVVYMELSDSELDKYKDFIKKHKLKVFKTVKNLSSQNLKVELVNINQIGGS